MARRSTFESRVVPFLFGLLIGAGLLYFFLPGPGSAPGKPQTEAQRASRSQTAAPAAATLETVHARGYLQCGVSQGLPGFSNPDDRGNWAGIDADFCRAVAAAVFGDPA
ncbi:MAG: hypothetical protein WBG82_16000, partial [Parvibaculum sp.]